jgi:hypothetical protein
MAIYQLLIKWFNPMRFLFGMRLKRRSQQCPPLKDRFMPTDIDCYARGGLSLPFTLFRAGHSG